MIDKDMASEVTVDMDMLKTDEVSEVELPNVFCKISWKPARMWNRRNLDVN